MRYVAHHAWLDAPAEGAKEGASQRVHLEGLVRRGIEQGKPRPDLVTKLEGPEPEHPEALDYLYNRFRTLHGMRGQSVHGLAPFTPEAILAANALFDWELTPIEVDGLRSLDLAYRHPASVLDAQKD
jgi:hypothetical protein